MFLPTRSDLTSAVKLTKHLVKKYRLPEPVRLAQLAANQQKEGGIIDVVIESRQGPFSKNTLLY